MVAEVDKVPLAAGLCFDTSSTSTSGGDIAWPLTQARYAAGGSGNSKLLRPMACISSVGGLEQEKWRTHPGHPLVAGDCTFLMQPGTSAGFWSFAIATTTIKPAGGEE